MGVFVVGAGAVSIGKLKQHAVLQRHTLVRKDSSWMGRMLVSKQVFTSFTWDLQILWRAHVRGYKCGLQSSTTSQAYHECNGLFGDKLRRGIGRRHHVQRNQTRVQRFVEALQLISLDWSRRANQIHRDLRRGAL